MARKTTYKVKMRRRRKGITDYRSRLALLKSKKKRLVVRASNKKIVAQIIEYHKDGDKTVVNTSSLELKRYGWKGHNGNVCAAYLTGFLCGKKALDKKISEAVLDMGLHTPVHKSNVFAVLLGSLDAGLKIPHNEKALPSKERVMGKDIERYRKTKLDAEKVKENILTKKVEVRKKVKG